ncbi:MAG: arylsulfatase [Promethearchaeota archaeon]
MIEKPHILLLVTDQQRGDALGCAGNPVVKTPNVDALARDGVVFTRAYSSTPSCTPARSGLLTGLAPWNHGMLGYGRGAAEYEFEMPRMLRNAGYYTFGVGKMHWNPQRNLHGFHGTLLDESGRVESAGFVSDYRAWFHEVAPDLDPDATGIGWNENTFGDYALPEWLHPTSWTGRTAVSKIEDHDPSRPLFLKVSFARPHSPYDAPSRFARLYDWKDAPAPVVGSWASRFAAVEKRPSPAFGDFGEEFAKRARRHYYANITFIDEQVGAILGALKSKGMYDETLVLFTSDHGDMLGDHHHWRKAYPYEGSARIPMLLKWPAGTDVIVPRGSSLDHLVELRDVLPTFLDAAGLGVPAGMDGSSLLGLLGGGRPRWRTHLHLEHSTTYHWHNSWVAATDGDFKYVFFRPTGEEQLFDLRGDPGETTDLAGDPNFGDRLVALRGNLLEHLLERGPSWVSAGRIVRTTRVELYSPNFPDWTSRVVEARDTLVGPLFVNRDGLACVEAAISPQSTTTYELPLVELLEEEVEVQATTAFQVGPVRYTGKLGLDETGHLILSGVAETGERKVLVKELLQKMLGTRVSVQVWRTGNLEDDFRLKAAPEAAVEVTIRKFD